MSAVMEQQSVAYGEIPIGWQQNLPLTESSTAIVYSAPEGRSIYVAGAVIGADDLAARANLNVDTVVDYGEAFEHMRGLNLGSAELFTEADRNKLPDMGVYILGDHVKEADDVASDINATAQRVIAEAPLDQGDAAVQEFLSASGVGQHYFGLARRAYELTAEHVPAEEDPYRIALLRTGALTRRLAHGVSRLSPEWNQEHEKDVDVVMKRAHPNGRPSDMWALTKWHDRSQLAQLEGQPVEIADFVLATGASLGGVVLSALMNDVSPGSYDFRFAIGTEAGIAFWMPFFKDRGIKARFSMLRAAHTMNEQYYLMPPDSVWDAGDATEAFMPLDTLERSRQ